jgi:hypothetical protein
MGEGRCKTWGGRCGEQGGRKVQEPCVYEGGSGDEGGVEHLFERRQRIRHEQIGAGAGVAGAQAYRGIVWFRAQAFRGVIWCRAPAFRGVIWCRAQAKPLWWSVVWRGWQVFQRQQRGLGLTPREIADRWAKLKSEIAEMQASGRGGSLIPRP